MYLRRAVIPRLLRCPSSVLRSTPFAALDMQMRFFANFFLMTFLVVVDGTCSEAEKEKVTGELFPNYLYRCSLAARSDTSSIAPCLEGPCQISSGCANCFNNFGACALSNCGFRCFFFGTLSATCRNCVANACNAPLLRCTGLTKPLSAPTAEGDRCL
ncbi:hypothetical protein FOZ60_009843 [Perkinsus olseni]|uniref:Uncharacterized protein n=1 Tax=Perkinsus olseni TaxID=32597 RepID=A0A7J6PMU2_PEROL|nr:hypothetical protein FOZ60_009843 [Perkinsus olseni]